MMTMSFNKELIAHAGIGKKSRMRIYNQAGQSRLSIWVADR
jgi:hypothetical protein